MIAGQIGVYFIKLGGVGACRIELLMQMLVMVKFINKELDTKLETFPVKLT